MSQQPASSIAISRESGVGDELGWTSGGEMGQRMREANWQSTALGAVTEWPASLKSALSICLGSRFPIAIYWGPELTLLYNDAWSPIPGRKHPWALGRGAREVWPEIWDTIGPMFEQVLTTGVATYAEDSLLLMHRHGYPEECYFNFTFTPIRGPGGEVEGVFNAVIETTYRVLDERRNKALERLADGLRAARGVTGVAYSAIELLSAALDDVPFCALYLTDGSPRGPLTLLDARGAAERAIELPRAARPIDEPFWRFTEAQTTASTQVVNIAGIDAHGEPARHSAMVVPLPAATGGASMGLLVIGASPRRSVDGAYRRFAERAAAQIASDLTAAAALEAEQQRAESLAELDRAKTAFFSNVSHELRTPLTLMLGPTEQALASPGGGLSGEALAMVHRNQQRLLRLVNELLDFSRAQAGRARAEFAPVDLVRVSREIASAFAGTAEQAGLALIVDGAEAIAPVYLDVALWERVLLNLLMNAFKFTFEGEIRVRLLRDGAKAKVVVADTGIGIDEAELPKIFERFHRVPGARGRSHEGSGIGLSLVQELVSLHHGSVDVESTPGRGARFTVTLPIGREHLRDDEIVEFGARPAGRAAQYASEASRWLTATDSEAPPSRLPRAKQRILVADDNEDMRAYVARLLREHWQVSTASDGESALQELVTSPFDLVVTDVMMPGLSGFELLAAIRNTSGLTDLPVVMLSARAGDEQSVEALAAGADDYLVKPFSARELIARVRARLEVATAKKEALLARAHLRSLFEHAPVAISVTRGREQRFEIANAYYRQMIGGRELEGKTLREAFPELPADAPVLAMMDSVYDTGVAYSADEYLVPLDRSGNGVLEDRYFKFTCEPIKDLNGKVEAEMAVAVDVTDQVAARKLLEHERQRLASIIQNLPVAVTLTDERGVITHTNKALAELWRRPIDGPISQSAYGDFLAYHADGSPYVTQDWPNMQVLRTREPYHLDELRFRRADGSEGWMRVDGVAVGDESAGSLEALVTCIDITEQKQTADALEAARAEAERANRAKDEFLAMLGHELRNPLSPIVSALHLLDAKGHQARELAVIKRQVDHLSRLVDDLLDVSRITRGKTELRWSRFELGPVVLSALEMTAPLFTAQKQSVHVDVPTQGLLVDGDAARISQVAANLLTNASKYSPPETRIELVCSRRGDNVQLRVRDAGYGIARELIGSIFELFFQLPQGSDRSRGGLGLGLAIVKSLVELHGGTVTAESEGLGKGSLFTVELPLAADDRAPSGPLAVAEPVLDLGPLPRRVLIVDDNRDAADLLAQVMRQAGYQVLVANSSQRGLEIATASLPEVCLLDIGLPDMDGLELARMLRQRVPDGHPLLIAVTGYGQAADIARSTAAGFDAHLVKPVTLDALEQAIRRARARRGEAQRDDRDAP